MVVSLRRYLFSAFLPIFVGALFFFMMVLELADLVPNLWKYVTYNATIAQVGQIMLAYAPKCLQYGLPISLLFAVSYTLGDLYAKNELVAVFNSGVSLYSFVVPFLVFGLLMSVGSFFFEDMVVIKSVQRKADLQAALVKQDRIENNNDVTVMSAAGRYIYTVRFYNAQERRMQGVTVVERDENSGFVSQMSADSGIWQDGKWLFSNVVKYGWNDERSGIIEMRMPSFSDPSLCESPSTFRKRTKSIEQMPVKDAMAYITQLRNAGFPFGLELAEYYKKFSFSLTPFIVVLLSSTIGGQFRKNIMLMSLGASLGVTVVYYCVQMLTMILAKLGYIPPIAGAWTPFLLICALSAFMFRHAKT